MRKFYILSFMFFVLFLSGCSSTRVDAVGLQKLVANKNVVYVSEMFSKNTELAHSSESALLDFFNGSALSLSNVYNTNDIAYLSVYIKSELETIVTSPDYVAKPEVHYFKDLETGNLEQFFIIPISDGLTYFYTVTWVDGVIYTIKVEKKEL